MAGGRAVAVFGVGGDRGGEGEGLVTKIHVVRDAIVLLKMAQVKRHVASRKNARPMKNCQCVRRDSRRITVRARVMLPSGPRSASPGPRMASWTVFTTASSSNTMPSTVKITHIVVSDSGASSRMASQGASTMPVNAKPARRAA